MTVPDYFGISDSVKRLTAPAGLEDVHQDGMSWAVQGEDWRRTTRVTVEMWNAIIAQFRGLLTIAGVDLDDLSATSPLILREALTRAIVAVAPAAIAANADSIAAELAGETAFINAMVAAAPFDAAALTTGTLPDARLSARLSTTGELAPDANAITNTGFYRLAQTAANIPTANDGMLIHLQYSPGTAVQMWFRLSSASTFIRRFWESSWSAWTAMTLSTTELDAAYAKLSDPVKHYAFGTDYFEVGPGTVPLGRARLVVGTGASIGYLSLRDAAGVAKVTIGSGDNTTGAEISFHDGFPGIDVKNGWLRVAGNAVLDAGSRPDGSQAVAEAGTDTTLRTWTAAHIKAAILALTPAKFKTEYVSAETTITLSSTLTFAHGLGVVPKVKQAILRCKTPNLNYAVGDEIDLRDAYSGATNAAYASGAAADATNIMLILRYAPALIDKSAPAGSPANIDTAKWKLVVRAWA